MELITVNSEMIHALGYDDEVQELEAIFMSGGIYRYTGVPRHVYEEMMASASIGRYMHEHIIEQYPYYEVSRKKRRKKNTE